MENLPTRIAGIYIYRVFLNFLVFALLFISTALEARQGIENKVVKNIVNGNLKLTHFMFKTAI